MWRHITSNAINLLLVAIFLVGGVIMWGKTQYNAPGPLAQQICLRVETGSSMGAVSKNLEGEGAVSNGRIFRIGADYTKMSSKLKAGSFLVPASASMEEIVDIVTRGGASSCGVEVVYRIGITRSKVLVRELDPASNRYVEVVSFDPAEEEAPEAFNEVRAQNDTRYRIAIAEGVTSWQVVDALGRIDLLEGKAGAVPAEGSLAPDSYEVGVGDRRADVIARMSEAQAAYLAAAWEGRADGIAVKTMEEALVLASIIEKETGIVSERQQVASVFNNRLERGMRLQTDPTVIYGITKGERILGRGLRRSELRKATPWNTYVIEGLPPTPIANPGRAAIEAAVHPDATDYVFFVADGTGGHAFAATLDEHNKNVAAWRKIEAARGSE